MLAFLVLALLATLLTARCLLRAQRASHSVAAASDEAEWAVMVARRREIETDPNLDETLRATLIAEWQEQAAAAGRIAQPAAAVKSAALPRWLLPALVIVGSVGTYLWIGSPIEPAMHIAKPGFGVPSTLSRSAPPRAGENHPGDGSLEERIALLEQKLSESPDNLEGWVILARSRALQRDYPAAARALEQALKLAPGHPDLLADLADATAMMNNESLAGRPMELVAEALRSRPDHPKSLALAATAAMQAGDNASAITLWKRLRAQFPPTDPDYGQIGRILAELGDTEADVGTSATAAAAAVQGQVAFSPAAIERVRKQALPDTAVLFVVAKAIDGPPMPLAVVRLPIDDLVRGRMVNFTLDDSQAMAPQLVLSKFPNVSIEARVSLTGNAVRQPGDWSVQRSPVRVGGDAVLLQIDPPRP